MSSFEIINEPMPEPNWVLISHKYASLQEASLKLGHDLNSYDDALRKLDGLGTSIANAKERIFLLREEIAQMEKAK